MKSMRRRFIAALVFGSIAAAAAPAGMAEAQAKLSKAQTELIAADNARYEAMINNDAPALDKVLGDELLYIHSRGDIQTKAQHMGDITSGRASYKGAGVEEHTASVYGNAGVIQGIMFEQNGKARLRYTSVYVKRDKRWQMVMFSCSRLGQQTGAPGGAPAGGPPGAPPIGGPAGGPPRAP